MDGKSLTRLLHRRGINVRYLGDISERASKVGPRLQALKDLAEQEMISRAFKHAANQHLRALPAPFAAPCLAHLLNCLLGTNLNRRPIAEVDESLKALYQEVDVAYAKVTPESFQADIAQQVFMRFRYDLGASWVSRVKHIQLLRDIALKLGLQLEAKKYNFVKDVSPNGVAPGATDGETSAPLTNGHATSNGHAAGNGHATGNGKKKKKNGDHATTSSPTADELRRFTHTFLPEDIVNLVPVVKDSSPKVSKPASER